MNDDERTIELMNLAIDGRATPQQLTELQQTLASSLEARITYESLQRVSAALDGGPSSNLPAGFRDDVLTSLRAHRKVTPIRRHRGRSPLLWAAAAAVFLLLALPLAFRLGSGAVDPRDAAGAAAGPWRAPALSASQDAEILEVVARAGSEDAELQWDSTTFELVDSLPELRHTPAIAKSGSVPVRASESVRVSLRPRRGGWQETTIRVLAGERERARIQISLR